MPTPDISVVLCTLNRASSLAETLRSYAHMAREAACVAELILVDNGSTDDTAVIIDRFTREHPAALACTEPRCGLSQARNRGLTLASAPLVAFTDDDVDFHPGWLDALVDAFAQSASPDGVAGRIEPRFVGAPPPWLSQRLLPLYSCTQWGDHSRWMTAQELPFGANMAFRREILLAARGFSAELGRQDGKLLSNEETELCHRLVSQGRKFRYHAEARVWHRIQAERLTRGWLLRRHYWQGVSDVITERLVGVSGDTSERAGLSRDLRKLLHQGTGGFRSLREIFWHWHSTREWARCAYLCGRLVQGVRERLHQGCSAKAALPQGAHQSPLPSAIRGCRQDRRP